LLLTVLRSIIQQHLTIRTAYISDYSKPLPELSCLESRLISELQGAPGSLDHQASPSSLFGYQNTTDSHWPRGRIYQCHLLIFLVTWLCHSGPAIVALPWWLCHDGSAVVQFSLPLYLVFTYG